MRFEWSTAGQSRDFCVETSTNSCDDFRADCRAAGGGTTSTGAGDIAIVNCIAIPAPPGGGSGAPSPGAGEVASDADVAANEVHGATDAPADLADLIADAAAVVAGAVAGASGGSVAFVEEAVED